MECHSVDGWVRCSISLGSAIPVWRWMQCACKHLLWQRMRNTDAAIAVGKKKNLKKCIHYNYKRANGLIKSKYRQPSLAMASSNWRNRKANGWLSKSHRGMHCSECVCGEATVSRWTTVPSSAALSTPSTAHKHWHHSACVCVCGYVEFLG